MFDHGIMIDYQSTDRSVEIIRSMAPSWEIRPSRNQTFDAYELDKEVTEIEQTIKGWKIALNTTEFLLCPNIHEDIDHYEKMLAYSPGMQTAGVVMCDSTEEFNKPLNNNPLIFQRFSGRIEPPPTIGGSRHRLLHKASHGMYYTGRHWTRLGDVIYRPEIFCVWFGWSPYPQVKPRKLQIQTRIPPAHIGTALGIEHQINSEQMDLHYQQHQALSSDLRNDPLYFKTLAEVNKVMYEGHYTL